MIKSKSYLFWIFFSLGTTVTFSLAMLLFDLSRLDDWAYRTISVLIHDNLTPVVGIISHAGSSLVIIVVIAVLLIIPYTRKKAGIPAAFIALSVWAFNFLIKTAINRERPDILRLAELSAIDSSSFPSGHSMVGIAFYGFLIVWCHENIKIRSLKIICTGFLTILILLIGLSRIYLGVHYCTDVLGGFVYGFFFLIVFTAIYRRYIQKNIKLLQN